ncbi:hypothetical protein KCM76_23375 [Zooshikella marina]|uniref:hypothetical protein n=1 Tax=Zooshikella ganghwensis TaxID=202772 RepID=UPI001BB0D63E|nr:hypothetical protein [Zooshikella ganghwensis]MBU2708956.1 hypothetical protein [Zooshikella ganghwensis]
MSSTAESNSVQNFFDTLFKDIPRELTLSELINTFKLYAGIVRGKPVSQISFHTTQLKLVSIIYFDSQPDIQDYHCKYALVVDSSGKAISLQTGKLVGFERYLFQLQAACTKLILDFDVVNPYCSAHEELQQTLSTGSAFTTLTQE